MNARREKIKSLLSKLHQDRERFWAQTDVKAYSVAELFGRFLEFTGSADPDVLENIALSTFAEDCYRHLGWSYTCEVYEHLLAEEIGDMHWLYHSWTLFGTSLMKDTENLTFDERVLVATDVEAVFERAALDLGFYWTNTMGHFYYDHPLKSEQQQLYLPKSKEWFERAIESDDFNECDHHDVQVLGHVFFELGDFEKALQWYEKFEPMEDICGDACFLDRALAIKRLAECRQRLSYG